MDVRYNLDPFQERTDDEIWSALEKCHIRQTVRTIPAAFVSVAVFVHLSICLCISMSVYLSVCSLLLHWPRAELPTFSQYSLRAYLY